MNIEETRLPGVKIITPARHTDDRGFFSESYNQARLASHGINTVFLQDNHSFSSIPGTVRGLHFQSPPHEQAKLVRCGQGSFFDVAVDIRKGSPTYGEWVGVELSFENGRQLYVPVGFLHGFATRTQDVEIIYKCSDYYAPECEGSVRFDDPAIGIDWGAEIGAVVLSEKDAMAHLLAEIDNPFVYQGSD